MKKKIIFACTLLVATVLCSFAFMQREITAATHDTKVRAMEYDPSMIQMYGYMTNGGCQSGFDIVDQFTNKEEVQRHQELQQEHPCSYFQYLLTGPGKYIYMVALFLLLFGLAAIHVTDRSFIGTGQNGAEVVEKKNLKKFLTTSQMIWIVWLVLTGVYISFNMFGYPMEQTEMKYELVGPDDGVYGDSDFIELSFIQYSERHPRQAILTTAASVLGVFVPYGLDSGMLFVFSPIFSFLSLIFFVVSMGMSGRVVEKYGTTRIKKIIVALFALALVTIVVDFVRGTPFVSWDILLHAGTPHYCC